MAELNIYLNRDHVEAEDYNASDAFVEVKASNSSRTHLENTDILVLLDVSGSMNGAKLDTAKSALKYMLTRMGTTSRFSLITFADAPAVVISMNTGDGLNTVQVYNRIDAITAHGNTNIGAAVITGMTQLSLQNKQKRRAEIILLTDGENNCGPEMPVVMQQTANYCRWPITTISLGPQPNAKMLLELAKSSPGGTYRHIHDVGQITNAFASFMDALTCVSVYNAKLSISVYNGVRMEDYSGCEFMTSVVAPQKHIIVFLGSIPAGTSRGPILNLIFRKLTPEERDMFVVGATQMILNASLHYTIDGSDYTTHSSVSVQRDGAQPSANPAVYLIAKLRSRVGKVVDSVLGLCDKGNFERAREILGLYMDTLAMEPTANSPEVIAFVKSTLAELTQMRKMMDVGGYAHVRNSLYYSSHAYSTGDPIHDEQKIELGSIRTSRNVLKESWCE